MGLPSSPLPTSRHVPGGSDDASPRTTLRPSSRETILDAAEAVVLADGAAHLTLDAVAERAAVSKGGLLYHFKTKDLLLQAMIDRHMQRLDADHAAALLHFPPGPGRDLKANVRMAAAKADGCDEKRIGCSLLAAAANHPKLLAPVQRFHQGRMDLLRAESDAGLPFERAAIVSLAVDGLCLLELLGLSPFDAAQRRRILDDVLRLVDETVANAGHCPRPAGTRPI